MEPFRASAGFTSDWRHFALEIADRVYVDEVTLDRPDKLNAWFATPTQTFATCSGGAPPGRRRRGRTHRPRQGFLSGGDVQEIIGRLLELDAKGLLEFTRMTGSVVQAMRDCPQPIIAAVNGIAAGAVACLPSPPTCASSPAARFAFLFTKVGLAGADMGSAYLLPRLVGVGRATELLLLGTRSTPRPPIAMAS